MSITYIASRCLFNRSACLRFIKDLKRTGYVSHQETCDWWMVLKVWVEAEGHFFPLELVSSKHSHRTVSTNCQLKKEYKSKILGKKILILLIIIFSLWMKG